MRTITFARTRGLWDRDKWRHALKCSLGGGWKDPRTRETGLESVSNPVPLLFSPGGANDNPLLCRRKGRWSG